MPHNPPPPITFPVGSRVCIRVATRRWFGYTDHILVYFADSRDHGDLIACWDLTTDTFEPVPVLSLRKDTGWTRPATRDETERAKDDLELRIGARVVLVRRID